MTRRNCSQKINDELPGTLHEIELDDWARFGKVRKTREKELRVRMMFSWWRERGWKNWSARGRRGKV